MWLPEDGDSEMSWVLIFACIMLVVVAVISAWNVSRLVEERTVYVQMTPINPLIQRSGETDEEYKERMR